MMRAVWAIASKDLLQIVRDKGGLFWRFGFPLVMAVLFGSIFSGQGGGGVNSAVPVLVVDEDGTERSAEFIESLAENDALDVRTEFGDPPAPIELERAREEVRRGHYSAFIALKPGFGAALKRPFTDERAAVEIGVDPSRSVMAQLVEGLLTKEAFMALQDTFRSSKALREFIDDTLTEIRADVGQDEDLGALENYLVALDTFIDRVPVEEWWEEAESAAGEEEPESDDALGWSPIEISRSDVLLQREGPRSGFEVSFPQAIVWALLGGAATFALSMVVERRKGTLLRLQTAPLSRAGILAGKSVAAILSLLAACGLLMLFGTSMFGVRPYSWSNLALALLCGTWAMTGIVMLLAQLGRTEESVGGIVWAVLLIMAMTGGGMVPLFVMPPWMQTASHLSPLKWVTLSLEGAIWREFSLSEMLFPCGVGLAVGTACFFLGVRLMRWGEREE